MLTDKKQQSIAPFSPSRQDNRLCEQVRRSGVLMTVRDYASEFIAADVRFALLRFRRYRQTLFMSSGIPEQR
jgi:hypothetical protein